MQLLNNHLNEERNRMCRYVIEHCPAPFIASGWDGRQAVVTISIVDYILGFLRWGR